MTFVLHKSTHYSITFLPDQLKSQNHCTMTHIFVQELESELNSDLYVIPNSSIPHPYLENSLHVPTKERKSDQRETFMEINKIQYILKDSHVYKY